MWIAQFMHLKSRAADRIYDYYTSSGKIYIDLICWKHYFSCAECLWWQTWMIIIWTQFYLLQHTVCHLNAKRGKDRKKLPLVYIVHSHKERTLHYQDSVYSQGHLSQLNPSVRPVSKSLWQEESSMTYNQILFYRKYNIVTIWSIQIYNLNILRLL